MQITVRDEKNAVILAIEGRIDATTSAELESSLSQVVSGEFHTVIVNMAKVDYMSSSGLRVFLAKGKELKGRKREIFFAGITGSILKVFKFAGFHMLFKMFDTEEDALAQV